MPFSAAFAFSLGLLSSCARDERSARTADSSLDAASPASGSKLAFPNSSSGSPAAVAPSDPDPSLAFTPPAKLHLPSNLKPNERLPLLLVLHGYGVPSALLIAKAGLAQLANEKRFAYLVPDGNRDSSDRPFWNAGPSCCNIDGAQVDDVSRLSALLESAAKTPALDDKRVFLIGYSNGGFMAHRLACAIGKRLAGVISVSGAAPPAAQTCEQNTPLAIVQIHGEIDPIVHYAGGKVFDRADFAEHASAIASVQSWADRLGCSGKPRRSESRDLEPALNGAETEVLRFQGCRGAVELWTVQGGAHYVALERPAFEAMWSFLQSHPKEPP